MPKAMNAHEEEVSQWPLVIAVCLLALGAAWNSRLGNDRLTMVLAAAAVIIPLVGFCLRAYRRRSKAPRIRRVYVAIERNGATMPLETAKYFPAQRYGPPSSDDAPQA
jgi:hypothetical protein